MKRLLGNLAGLAALAIPSLRWLMDIIGLASLPEDLSTWSIVLKTMLEDSWLVVPAGIGLAIIAFTNVPGIRFWERKVDKSKPQEAQNNITPDLLLLEPKHRFSLTWDPPHELSIITQPLLVDDEASPLRTRFPIFRLKNLGSAVAQGILIEWDMRGLILEKVLESSQEMMAFITQLPPGNVIFSHQEKGARHTFQYPYRLLDKSKIKYLAPEINNEKYLDIEIPALLYHAIELYFTATLARANVLDSDSFSFPVTISFMKPENHEPKTFTIKVTAQSIRPSGSGEVRIPINGKMRVPPTTMAEVKFDVSI